jgi:hypothetical protein
VKRSARLITVCKHCSVLGIFAPVKLQVWDARQSSGGGPRSPLGQRRLQPVLTIKARIKKGQRCSTVYLDIVNVHEGVCDKQLLSELRCAPPKARD